MGILDAPALPAGVVAAARNASGVVTPAAAAGGGGLGAKADVACTGITVYPDGNRNVSVEFGASAIQTLVGATGSVYLTLVDVTPDVTTRAILQSAIVPLPNSTNAALSSFTLSHTFDLGVLTQPHVLELQVLVFSTSGGQPGISLVNSAVAPTYLRQRGLGAGYSMSASNARIQAGEVDQVWTPNLPWTGCPVILCHGRGENAQFTHATTQRSSVLLAAALARAGIPCIAGDMGSTGVQPAWGNDTAETRVGQAWTYLKTAFPHCRQDKVVLLAVSMGAVASSRWLMDNKTKVAAYVGIIPLFDLVGAYTANVGGFGTEMATAWGLVYPAALPARANVLARVAEADGIPHLIGYSSVDTTVVPAGVQAYAAGVHCSGANLVVTDSTFGHSDQAVGGLPVQTVIDFIRGHAS